MLVSFPFTVRKDNLETRTVEAGTLEATLSELKLFFETEEGEVEHVPDYGVKKRDILFNSEIDDVILGVLLLRIQEKVNIWFNDITIKDIYQKDEDSNSKTRELVIVIDYGGQEGNVEVNV